MFRVGQREIFVCTSDRGTRHPVRRPETSISGVVSELPVRAQCSVPGETVILKFPVFLARHLSFRPTTWEEVKCSMRALKVRMSQRLCGALY